VKTGLQENANPVFCSLILFISDREARKDAITEINAETQRIDYLTSQNKK
jgi:hypothetical protein